MGSPWQESQWLMMRASWSWLFLPSFPSFYFLSFPPIPASQIKESVNWKFSMLLNWQPQISSVSCLSAKVDTVKALLRLSQQDIKVVNVSVCACTLAIWPLLLRLRMEVTCS